jgi:hypothetical protein
VPRREAHDTELGEYWVQYEPANLVDWGVFRVPETFTAGFLDARLRLLIEVLLEPTGPECVAISRLDYDAPPLTSKRRFPLRGMVSAAVRSAAFEVASVPIEEADPRRENARLVPDDQGRVTVLVPAFDERGRPREQTSQRRGSGPDFERVAALYRRAVAAGWAPSAVIAAEFGVSPTTARKWVQRTRARGLLRPAVGRRVGEATVD